MGLLAILGKFLCSLVTLEVIFFMLTIFLLLFYQTYFLSKKKVFKKIQRYFLKDIKSSKI